jgi:hypothetical protein
MRHLHRAVAHTSESKTRRHDVDQVRGNSDIGRGRIDHRYGPVLVGFTTNLTTDTGGLDNNLDADKGKAVLL